ncbi:unnamed protein product, partial [Ectocarpus sp. 12 AP-2014]
IEIFQDVLVYKRATIARKYVSTWFGPDVLGTVPFASLIGLFITTVDSLQSVNFLRQDGFVFANYVVAALVRVFRLLKLMRILRLSRKMAKVDFSRRLNPSIVRLIKLLGKIVFAGHLLGCTWFMVDECDVDGGDDMWPKCGGESLGSKVR